MMSLDYTDPDNVVNFRDVGVFINMITGKRRVREGCLFRGGTLKYASDPSVFGAPKTVFNLQRGPDPESQEYCIFHFPISNDYEKYQTSVPEVRVWLRQIIGIVAGGVELPLYIHCLSGKDRTGVVIAAVLKILEVEDEFIVEEYLLSDGDVKPHRIREALEGIGSVVEYFHGIDLISIRQQFGDGPQDSVVY